MNPEAVSFEKEPTPEKKPERQPVQKKYRIMIYDGFDLEWYDCIPEEEFDDLNAAIARRDELQKQRGKPTYLDHYGVIQMTGVEKGFEVNCPCNS